jgi:PPOX class probable F420-dependent enzyme
MAASSVLTEAQDAFLSAGRFALLITTGAAGGPQSTMVSYHWDGTDIVVSLRDSAVKWANVQRQPRVALTVVDGQKYLSVYGRAEAVTADPQRYELSRRLQASLSEEHAAMLEQDFVKGLDAAHRVVVRLVPTRASGRC